MLLIDSSFFIKKINVNSRPKSSYKTQTFKTSSILQNVKIIKQPSANQNFKNS